jgi:NAD(P)-dependent dehydrogenase (short-subunit alcohol dehydrogenase family)/acyl carrier protein
MIMQTGRPEVLVREPLADVVISIIAEVTRYPRSILRPEAELEEELGIESVKRAEILAVLTKRLGLAVPADAPLGKLRTIADVVRAVERLGAGGSPAPEAAPPELAPPAAAPAPAPPPVAAPLAEIVVSTIAEVTRYPRSILTPEAELEEELGIESVKRAEILAVLAKRLGLAVPADAPLGKLRTIADVVRAVERLGARAEPRNGNGAGAAHRPPPSAAAAPPRDERRPEPARAPEAGPFAGKVALVTGSGHGLGKGLAAHLARLGAAVVVNSFHSREKGDATAAELTRAGHRAIHAWGSVCNPAHVDEIFACIESSFGRLDFLVSAASNAPRGPVAAFTAEDWDRAFQTEVVALHAVALRAAKVMERGGGGKIVAISHPGAHRCHDGFALAGPVKAAVESLARYLAVELGPRKIQVNAVCAGPLAEELAAHPERERLGPAWEKGTPGKRLPDASDVAAAVAFLLGDEARMVTGTTLFVDAGLSLAL